LLQHRADWHRFAAEYRETTQSYANLAPHAEGGRLAQYAAAIDLAAALVHKALDLPWGYKDPLAALWNEIVTEAAHAAGAPPAPRDVRSWAYSHEEAFGGRERFDHDECPIPPPSGWAGRWDPGNKWEFIGFLPTVLQRVLREQGYEPEAILAEWRERG